MKLGLIAMLFALMQQQAVPPPVATGTIRGVVTQPGTTKGIPDVSITITINRLGATDAAFSAKTDATGNFVVSNVPAGSWIVLAERDGFVPPDGSQERAIVTVTSQTPTSVNMRLLQTGAIRGRITDSNGNPLAGLEVEPLTPGFDQSGRRTWLAMTSVPRGASTDDHGEYRLYSCRPGEYYVRVRQLTQFRNTVAYFPGPADPGLASVVTIRAGEEAVANIVVPTFVSRKVSGNIHVDRTATDLLNVTLLATLADSRIPTEPLRMTLRLNGSDAAFSMMGVPPGSYEIMAQAGSPLAFSGRMTLDVGDRDLSGISLVLRPTANVKIRILPEAGIGSAALANTGISLVSRNPPASTYSVSSPDASGNRTASNLPEGVYEFRTARLPAGAFISAIRQGPANLLESGLKIGNDPPPDVEIVVSAGGGTIQGSTDLPAGAAAAIIVLAPETAQRRNSLLYSAIRTDAKGQFTMTGIAPGRYRLFAWDSALQTLAQLLNASMNSEFLAQYETSAASVTVNSGATPVSPKVPLIRKVTYPPIPVTTLPNMTAVPSNEPSGAVLAGVVTRSGKPDPVAGAKVTAVGTSNFSAISDANGRFRIAGLSPGNYFLRAERDGYFAPNPNPGTPLRITSDQYVEDISLQLRLGGAISGKLTGPDGKPMALTLVRAGTAIPAESASVSKQASTNERGEFRIFGLEPGSYIVGANPPSQSLPRDVHDQLVRTYFPNTPELYRAVPVEVAEGADVPNINFTLQRGQVFRVSGKVINTLAAASTTATASPAELYLIPQELSPLDSFSFIGNRNNVQPDGTFEIRNVQPGIYYAIAVAAGAGLITDRASAWTLVRVGQADLAGVALTIRPGVKVSGQIVSDDPRMRFPFTTLRLYAKGAPLNVDGQSLLSRPAVINSSGGFTISNVPPGAYVFTGPGLKDLYISDVRNEGNSVSQSGVTVGDTAVGSVQVLIGGAGTIVGTVRDGQGNGAPGVTVVLLPDLQRRGDPALYKTATTSATGAAGRFTIADVPPGNYSILAFQSFSGEPFRSVDFLDQYVSSGQTVTVSAGSGVNVPVTLIQKVLP